MSHLKPILLIRIRQQRIHRMLGDVVLSRIKRMNTLQLQNAPAAGHDGQFVGRHEWLAELLIVQPVTALLPARVALAISVDRLLAQRLRNALERARLLAAEEEDRGAAADDRLRVILIHGAQLALRLHEDVR